MHGRRTSAARWEILDDSRAAKAAASEVRRSDSEARTAHVSLRLAGPLPCCNFVTAAGTHVQAAGGGLITGLFTLPIAPVRGVICGAEKLNDVAERGLYARECSVPSWLY
ncbi:hypothetical protein [Streptomyces atratus]|uniref:hypothetical protein n=1 Tax=Streptomyces atratus TaxID=1893 RepID=UPI0033E36B26